MALIEMNLDPSRRDLRIFAGLLFPAFFGLIGGVVFHVSGSPEKALSIWIPALLVSALALAVPKLARLLYIGWMRAVQPIGWAVSHLVLLSAYYLGITPLGLIVRRLRKDRLTRGFDPSAGSYWVEYRPGEDAESYFRQF